MVSSRILSRGTTRNFLVVPLERIVDETVLGKAHWWVVNETLGI